MITARRQRGGRGETRIVRRVITTGIAAAIAALAVFAALSLTASRANAGTGTQLVPGYLNGLPLATRLGPASAGRKMTIGVELQRPNPAGEQALYQQMYQPGSAQYHHFLTPAQFNSRFGVSSAQTSAVRSWLTGGGLAIDTSSPDYFTATGTVAQLNQLMSVNIGTYSYKGQQFLANAAPASVPTSLPVAG
ncbi:MAG: protease pro-enzyme activation domain-containing protein, partial [Solirubrobacteraceae bacterium]